MLVTQWLKMPFEGFCRFLVKAELQKMSVFSLGLFIKLGCISSAMERYRGARAGLDVKSFTWKRLNPLV